MTMDLGGRLAGPVRITAASNMSSENRNFQKRVTRAQRDSGVFQKANRPNPPASCSPSSGFFEPVPQWRPTSI